MLHQLPCQQKLQNTTVLLWSVRVLVGVRWCVSGVFIYIYLYALYLLYRLTSSLHLVKRISDMDYK